MKESQAYWHLFNEIREVRGLAERILAHVEKRHLLQELDDFLMSKDRGFSVRAINVVRPIKNNNKSMTVEELSKLGREYLLGRKNCGRKTADEIEYAIKEFFRAKKIKGEKYE